MSKESPEAVCTFQSTLPVWGATDIAVFHRQGLAISIHAPRVGSDLKPKPRRRMYP